MKPPSSNPSKALVARKLALFVKAHWEIATIDHSTIWMGIHLSGPIFLDTNWEGSSARRNEMRKTTWPWL